MNNIEKYRLIHSISNYCALYFNIRQVIEIFREYDVKVPPVCDPSESVKSFVGEVLNSESFETVQKIERDLTQSSFAEPTVKKSGKNTPQKASRKVFLCHSINDKEFAEHLLDMLHAMGLNHECIFYSSAHGYGTNLGESFIQRLKEELSNDVLVIFLLSDNFFNSPMCMCEMGAAWITTREHVPILIPPFDFDQVKGVFPSSHGMKINDRAAYTSLHEKITEYFSLAPIKPAPWERARDRVVDRIEKSLNIKKPVDLVSLPRTVGKYKKRGDC